MIRKNVSIQGGVEQPFNTETGIYDIKWSMIGIIIIHNSKFNSIN